MSLRLTKEEVVTIRVLTEKGQNNCEIARTLAVTEGTVRYHLRRAAEGAVDGRSQRDFEVESMAAAIADWHAERKGEKRPVNVQELHEHLWQSTASGGRTARCCATCGNSTRGRMAAAMASSPARIPGQSCARDATLITAHGKPSGWLPSRVG